MFKSLIAGASLALAATGSFAANNTVSVSFDAYLEGYLWYVGSFTGTDSNNDGSLSLSELTSFVGTPQEGDAPLTLSSLSSFGDFTYATNTWHENGYIPYGWGNTGYFAWNGGNNALGQFDEASVTTTITSNISAVPEPTSLAMMGLGALALAVSRKRKSA